MYSSLETGCVGTGDSKPSLRSRCHLGIHIIFFLSLDFSTTLPWRHCQRNICYEKFLQNCPAVFLSAGSRMPFRLGKFAENETSIKPKPNKTITKIHSKENGKTTGVKDRDSHSQGADEFQPEGFGMSRPSTVADCHNLNQVPILHKGNNIPPSRFRSCRPVREQMIQIFNLYPFPFIITFNQFVEYIEIV